MRVRVFQLSRDLKNPDIGKRKAEWYIEWRDPDGTKHCKRYGTKKLADEMATAKLAELARADGGLMVRKPWPDFVDQYQTDYASRMRPRSREESKRVLDLFGKTMKPKFVDSITPAVLDQYVAKRLAERGIKQGDTLSRQTIRKELRTLRAALGQARKWNYLRAVPDMPSIDTEFVEKRHVLPQHFDALLTALDKEPSPVQYPFAGDYPGCTFTAAEWWVALLMFLWCTGMRIGATLALKWSDVDLDAGIARSRARDNKQKRDHVVQIGPVVELLRTIKGDDARVFPWDHAKSHLAHVYRKLQETAGIVLTCDREGQHVCTDACHCYCFHDFRRAHATENVDAVGAERLQAQMGHASFSTTRLYIAYAKRHKETAYPVNLPALAKAKAQGLRITGQATSPDGGQVADSGQNGNQTENIRGSVSA